jgi:hypothetical protein
MALGNRPMALGDRPMERVFWGPRPSPRVWRSNLGDSDHERSAAIEPMAIPRSAAKRRRHRVAAAQATSCLNDRGCRFLAYRRRGSSSPSRDRFQAVSVKPRKERCSIVAQSDPSPCRALRVPPKRPRSPSCYNLLDRQRRRTVCTRRRSRRVFRCSLCSSIFCMIPP